MTTVREIKRHGRRFFVAAVSVLFAASLTQTTAAQVPQKRFDRLVDAVAAGVISPQAVEAVRHGRATVIINVAIPSPPSTMDTEGTSRSSADVAATVRSLASEKVRLSALLGPHATRRDFPRLPAMAASVDSEARLLAIANSGVARVDADSSFVPLLDSSLPAIGQPAAAAAGYLGAGTYVAVLDTGVDYTRPAFGSCAAPGAPGCKVAELPPDFTTLLDGTPYNDGEADQACGPMHGTNVSAIVAGVAPAARLLVADVFQPSGSCSTQTARASDVLAALDYVVQRKLSGLNVVAVNLSFGDLSNWTTACPDQFGLGYLQSIGIAPVAAAGNGPS